MIDIIFYYKSIFLSFLLYVSPVTFLRFFNRPLWFQYLQINGLYFCILIYFISQYVDLLTKRNYRQVFLIFTILPNYLSLNGKKNIFPSYNPYDCVTLPLFFPIKPYPRQRHRLNPSDVRVESAMTSTVISSFQGTSIQLRLTKTPCATRGLILCKYINKLN